MRPVPRIPALALALLTALGGLAAARQAVLPDAVEGPGFAPVEPSVADRQPVPVILATGGATLVLPMIR
ncbi:hypothetical protein [Phenylobacterium sp.]|uniref:hypothetical protein n=1 Tax=Phenylobacterium sp. TaxID=1871053 RepID=UPI00301D0991